MLVIGAYATDSWAHSSFGRKIEKALEIREEGSQISIVSELHWVSFLPLALHYSYFIHRLLTIYAPNHETFGAKRDW